MKHKMDVIQVSGIAQVVADEIEFRISPEQNVINLNDLIPKNKFISPREMVVTIVHSPVGKKPNINDVIMDKIMATVCRNFNITSSAMMMRSRKREIVIPRQVAISMMMRYVWPQKSSGQIASYFNLDHASAYNCKKSIESWQTDKVLGWGEMVRRTIQEIGTEVETLKQTSNELSGKAARRAS